MITIISGTNRLGSNTKKVALQYARFLKEKEVDVNFLSLEELNVFTRDANFEKVEEEILVPTQNFIIVAPEYNGSFPGVLKAFIDVSIVESVWHNKTALLSGVSAGRAGNLRGMEHLTGILNHIKITVHPNKLPLSSINKLLNTDGYFSDPATISAINRQLDDFLNWI